MAATTRREREREEHRRLILEAAEAVFAEKGYHSATVQEIAELAEFSVGSLYNFFENKTDLYVEMLDMRAGEFFSDVQERVSEADDVLGKIRAAGQAHVEFFRRNRRFFLVFARLHTGDEVEGPVALPEATRGIYRDYIELMSSVFEAGIREGLIKDLSPRALALAMDAMLNASIGYWVHSGGEEDDAVPWETIEEVLFHGILTNGGER
jgi:TetR/AcrR family transcriptional regulator